MLPNSLKLYHAALQKYFKKKEELRPLSWLYTVEGSFLFIYTKSIRDLLNTGKDTTTSYEIKHDSTGTSVLNLNNNRTWDQILIKIFHN